MIEGIISSLLATAIVTVIVLLNKQGYWAEWCDTISGYLPHHQTNKRLDINNTQEILRFRRILIRKIVLDQSKKGIHFGQFGVSCTHAESARYQRNPEDLSTKPRMYLTLWPVFILHNRKLALGALRRAIKGVENLFEDNQIFVSQPIRQESLPYRHTQLISIRHTICGALLLYHVDYAKGRSIANAVLGKMLDKENNWQNNDGGWAHSDQEVTGSDLWGSAYALCLLNKSIENKNKVYLSNRQKVEEAIEKTVGYLKDSWNDQKWCYGGVSSEENAPLVFVEIAKIIKDLAPDLFDQVKSKFNDWLSPSGDISNACIRACSGIKRIQIEARISYALYKAGESSDVWGPLFDNVMQEQGYGLISSELAFMIDLTFVMEQQLLERERSQKILLS